MQQYIIWIVVMIIFFSFFYWYFWNKYNKPNGILEKRYLEEEQKYKVKVEELEKSLNKERARINQEISTLKQNYKLEQDIQKLNLEKNYNELKRQYDNEIEEYIDTLDNQCIYAQEQLQELSDQIDEYQTKQNVINDEILRRREIQEKEEYYKVQLLPDAIEDIAILNAAKDRLHNSVGLDKVIYDVYVRKPVNEMVKRILKTEPSGIYKITRLKTGEIYIGKSTNVADRWKQHCMSAFGVGSIATSILHLKMKEDGLQNFTFELLEEVDKADLGNRERYWINFYESNKYGLNEKGGG